MKEKVTFKTFFSTVWRGIVQVFQWFIGMLGMTDGSRYALILRRIIGTVVAIWMVMFTLAMVYAIFEDPIDRVLGRAFDNEHYYDDVELSRNVHFQNTWDDGFGRIYNHDTEKVTVKKVDWVKRSSDGDSLAVFAKGGKRGYINRYTGEIAIKAVYDKAWVFSEGLAAVKKDGRLMFIDHEGKVALDGGWNSCPDTDYVFRNGHCVVWTGEEGGVGVIDRQGAWVIEPSYDKIVWNDGLWVVGADGRFGVLSADLGTVLNTVYDDIRVDGGHITAQPFDAPTKLFDHEGNLLNDCVIDDVDELYYEYSYDQYAIAGCYSYSVRTSYDWDRKYGLLDRSGHKVTEAVYSSIEAIGYNLFLCEPHGVVVDRSGKVVE